LNYRPHAYQAPSYERELGSEVPTRLPFTNILLSLSCICEHLAHFREHFAHLNGHHNGHHRGSQTSGQAHFRYDLPHRSDPHADFDVASFGVVKVLDGQSAARGHR
jgi:hypothetical protein